MFKAVIMVLLLKSVCCDVIEKDFPRAVETHITASIQHYMDTFIGAAEMQKIIDKVDTTEEPISSSSSVQKLEESISQKLSNVATSVEKLRKALEENQETVVAKMKSEDCCKKATLMLDWLFPHHKTDQIDNTSYCLLKNEKTSDINIETDKMLSTAATNQRNYSEIKFQRYQGKNGALSQYPAYYHEIFCHEYDFWNLYSSSLGSKDLVVVMDTRLLKEHAEDMIIAVETVFEPLNSADNFGFVAFSNDITLVTGQAGVGCQSEMMSATRKNIEVTYTWLKANKWITGETNYGKSLDAAFDYLDSVKLSMNKKIILFVSDSAPSDPSSNILQTIIDRKKSLDETVTILTYGVKNSVNNDVLQKMADSEGFFDVENPYDLKKYLYQYLQHIKPPKTEDVQWQWPNYNKLSEDELFLTASQAVYIADIYRGVVSVDISMKVLLNDVINFQELNNDAYIFVLDSKFKVISHSFLSNPSQHEWTAAVVSIQELEKSDDLGKLLSKIQEKYDSESQSENTITMTMKTTWRAMKDKLDAEYVLHDSKVICATTAFQLYSICMAVKDDAKKSIHVKNVPIPENFSFQYHRIDLSDSSNDVCFHMHRASFIGSAVKLTPKAFIHPTRYLSENEDRRLIEKYENGIKTNREELITKSAIQDILLTFELENHWRKIDEGGYVSVSDIGSRTAWKYVGTENGVFRIWPGVQLSQAFDHRVRPWYRAALMNKDGNFSVTTPYMDAASAEWIITFSKSITLESSTGNKNLYAVIGFDIQIWKFYDMLKAIDTSERCREMCILLDQSGYIIYHHSMIIDNYDLKSHLLEFEPELSRLLIEDGILKRERCFDRGFRQAFNEYYAIDVTKLPATGENNLYNMEFLEGTNVILFSTDRSTDWMNWESCSRKEIRSSCTETSNSCQMPCFNRTHCDNKSNYVHSCIPHSPHIFPADIELVERDPCYGYMDDGYDYDELDFKWLASVIEGIVVLFVAIGCAVGKKVWLTNRPPEPGTQGLPQAGIIAASEYENQSPQGFVGGAMQPGVPGQIPGPGMPPMAPGFSMPGDTQTQQQFGFPSQAFSNPIDLGYNGQQQAMPPPPPGVFPLQTQPGYIPQESQPPSYNAAMSDQVFNSTRFG